MVGLALIAAPLGASPPTAGSRPHPVPAVQAPAIPVAVPGSPGSDPCTEAIAELEATYAFYIWTILACPAPLCIPLIYAAGDLTVRAFVNMLTACAF
jgi:hypothetical protein